MSNDLESELIRTNEELKSILYEIQAHVSSLKGKSVTLNDKIQQQKEVIMINIISYKMIKKLQFKNKCIII